MRQVVVNRAAAGIVAVLVGAVLLFGAVADRRGGAPGGEDGRARADDGRVAFDEYCGACHDAADLAAGLGAGSDAALLDFLATHGDAGVAADRAIVAYLRRLAAR
jgi:mono/diheme cytochrome c family protein